MYQGATNITSSLHFDSSGSAYFLTNTASFTLKINQLGYLLYPYTTGTPALPDSTITGVSVDTTNYASQTTCAIDDASTPNSINRNP